MWLCLQDRTPLAAAFAPLRWFALIFGAALLSVLPISARQTPINAPVNPIVNSLLDTTSDDGNCTLREAIIAVNTGQPSGKLPGECQPQSDTITFAPNVTGTLTLLSDAYPVTSPMTIDGPGGTALTIIGAHGVFAISGSINVSIARLHLQNSLDRASVTNLGSTVTLTDDTISDNTSLSNGGGLLNNGGTVTIAHSQFTGNRAAVGGAIYNRQGLISIANSQILHNTASAQGGAIYNDPFGTITITGTTIADNLGALQGGGLDNDGWLTVNATTLNHNTARTGGGVYNAGAVQMTNTTLFNNHATSGGGAFTTNTLSATFTTFCYNVAGAGSSFTSEGEAPLLASSVFVVDPALNAAEIDGPFTSAGYNVIDANQPDLSRRDFVTDHAGVEVAADNGGLTATCALDATSPAVDAVPPQRCTVATDQRGTPRQSGQACDSGSYQSP